MLTCNRTEDRSLQVTRKLYIWHVQRTINLHLANSAVGVRPKHLFEALRVLKSRNERRTASMGGKIRDWAWSLFLTQSHEFVADSRDSQNKLGPSGIALQLL